MIRFSKYIWLYFLISGLVLVPGIFSLVYFGLRPSIDFTGGAVMEVVKSASISKDVLTRLAQNHTIALVDVQEESSNAFVVRMKPTEQVVLQAYENDVQSLATGSAAILRLESVGPVLGKELLMKATIAAIVAIVGILLYVAYTFKNFTYGVSAVVALIHDVLVVFGIFSLLGHFYGIEVDTLFVTAFLTTMSFSVHDTIVVFDRIREYSRRGGRSDFLERADTALTETMGRSITNSLTIVFMLFALVLLGGETIRWFAVALLIGTISGTYSSPFVATPILMLWERFENRKQR